ncbi:E3 ubiquitin-protein ligase Iruka [Pseudolycoriella hygida]|uniref:E3 ubiquitin-protein ligase Iruka n=1 Tax=Pseudolycoriella hygida TaxID=35572 RepID=A0A9Q0MVI0_9DIPT|nr:E3 ubiquitin-protein ligase Iruka [Pseudolycoriella hygida]
MMAARPKYNRAYRIEEIRESIPFGYLIKFPDAMTAAQMQAIPKVTIAEKQFALRTQCAVCFCYFVSDEIDIRKLPCNHFYHEKCIFPWLQENASCPTCREPLINQEDEDFEDAIRAHFEMLTRDLLCHLALSCLEDTSDNTSAESDIDWDMSDTETQSEQRSRSSNTDSVQTSFRISSGVVVPRRAAALRAASLIKQMYRPRRAQNAPKNVIRRSARQSKRK